MFQWKVRLDTKSEIDDIFNAVSKVKDEVYLRSGDTLCVSAKSLLGCKLAAIEWDNLVCQCDTDIYTTIENFTTD